MKNTSTKYHKNRLNKRAARKKPFKPDETFYALLAVIPVSVFLLVFILFPKKSAQVETQTAEEHYEKLTEAPVAVAKIAPPPIEEKKSVAPQTESQPLANLQPAPESSNASLTWEPKPDKRFPELNEVKLVPPLSVSRGLSHRDYTENMPFLSGSFTISTSIPLHPSVRCDFVAPLDQNGNLAATATDVIALFPYPAQEILRGNENTTEWMLAKRYGFTVFTLNFPRAKDIPTEDQKAYYIYPESGTSSAWVESHKKLLALLKIPAKKMFVWGSSAGSSAAQLFASAHPELVEATALFGGMTYNIEKPFIGPSLIAHSHVDRVEPNQELVDRLTAAGFQPIHRIFPPRWTGRGVERYWAHVIDSSFGKEWVCSLADMRAREGKIVPPSNWPVIDGVPFPDSDICPTAWRSLVTKAVSGMDKNSECTWAKASPPPGKKVLGNLLWIDNRKITSEEELVAAAETMAGLGFRCLAIESSTGDKIRQSGIDDLLKQNKEFGSEIYLLTISPSTEDPAWSLGASLLIKGVAIIDCPKDKIPGVISICGPLAPRMAMVIKKSHRDGLNNWPKNMSIIERQDDYTAGPWLKACVDAVKKISNK